MNQAKELQELRQTVFTTSKNQIVCQHCKSYKTTVDNLSPILSPVSPSTESYFSADEEGSRCDNIQENETKDDSTNLSLRSDVMCFPQPDDPGVRYRVESNHDTKIALKLSQVHTSTQSTSQSRTYAAVSPDGKYLATAQSGSGTVQIFDPKTSKRLG